MNKFLTPLLLLGFPFTISANIIFSEIMYDLSGTDGNEWIEVQNVGASPIDLSVWKLFEANVNHGLKVHQGNPSVHPNGYAVIANDPVAFLSEFSNFSGTLFDSSFSLSNTGEVLVLRDENLVDSDSLSYDSSMGANSDGNSLHKSSTSWISSVPTPGSGLSGGSQSSNQSGGNQIIPSQTISTPLSSSPSSSQNQTSESFTVSIGKDRITAVGNRLIFTAETKKTSGQTRGASYSWSFGDGSMKNGQSVDYNYRYPGEYSVVLNASRGDEKVVARASVKVVDPVLEFTPISLDALRVENKGKDEVNLFEWRIESMGKSFVFPQDTLIKAGSSIVVPSTVSGLLLNPLVPIKVYNGLGVGYASPKQEDKKEVRTQTIPKKEVIVKTDVAPQKETSEKVEVETKGMEEEREIQSDQNTASVANAIEIQKPKNFWSRLKSFLKSIF